MRQRWIMGLGAVAGAAAAGVAVAKARRQTIERAALSSRLRRVGAMNGKNIVILGAGFAGINAAIGLLQKLPPESGWKVTLVDRHNFFLFTPLLYHAATGLIDPSAVLFPVRSISRAPHFSFREATVLDVDLGRQVVHLDDGPLPYDYLVLGLGAVTNFFGQQENVRHALTLKTAGDSVAVRNRLIDAFEAADIQADPEERRRLLTFVVVGGGATGIELIGAIRGLIHGTLARQYPRIRPEECRLMVVEAAESILPGVPPELAAHALQHLRSKGIDIRLSSKVERVDEEGLLVQGGEYIPSRTVVWTAGIRPAPVADRLPVPKIKNGRIVVDEFLQVESHPHVFALGDVAALEDPETSRPLPASAAVAVQQGKALPEILVARMEGRQPAPFRYQHRGELVSLGRNDAIAEVFGVRLTGFPAWVLWRAFYLSQLMGFKNQLTVALDWSFAYVYQRDTVRLELPQTSPLKEGAVDPPETGHAEVDESGAPAPKEDTGARHAGVL